MPRRRMAGEPEGAPEADGGTKSFARTVLGWLLETVIVIVGAIVISSLLRAFVAQMFIIPSGSMENTLQISDRVVVSKFGGFQRGDVVVFEDPGNWLTHPVATERNIVTETLEFIGVLPSSKDEYLIKRVIGMPGDHVRVNETGLIEVNGFPLDETNYLYSANGVQNAPAVVPFDIVVPAKHIFVLGDHRSNSMDSRCRLANDSQDPGDSAFVPVDKVVGAAVAIVAPLDRLATFDVPDTFADVPAPEEPAPTEAVLNHVEPRCN